MSNNDDERAASGILTNLSGFLVTASLAIIAIEGTLFVFVLGSRVTGPSYFIFSILAFLAFVFSIVCGGWGITETAEHLAKGTWKLSIGTDHFNKQALLAFFGLLFFILSTLFSGKPTETDIQNALITISTRTQELQSELKNSLQHSLEFTKGTKDQLDQLQQDKQSLKSQLEQIDLRIENLERSTICKTHKKSDKKPSHTESRKQACTK